MSELYRRLRREFVRSPKKTAILVIGLVVAGIFWAPLIWGKSKTDAAAVPESATNPSPAPEIASVVPASAGGAYAATTSVATAGGEPSWPELLVWMRSALGEETTEPVSTVTRDPFDAADPALAAAAATADEPESSETDLAEEPIQEDANRLFVRGLVVQGALKIGDQRFVRMAGRTLAAGDEFDPGESGEGDYRGDDWIVETIDPDGVTVRPLAGGEPERLVLRRAGFPGLRVQATGRRNE